MSLHSRLRQLAAALPSDSSAVTFTRADLRVMLDEDDVHESDLNLRDLRVEDEADETCRSPSTVRTWLISGQLRGYKLQGRAWRVPRSALRAFLDDQPFHRSKAAAASDQPRKSGPRRLAESPAANGVIGPHAV